MTLLPSWISSRHLLHLAMSGLSYSMDPSQRENDIHSDIDIAISTDLPDLQAERMRMHILGRVPANFDIQIFEHLPLFIQAEVIKGEVLYVVDEDELYDMFLKIFREYEFSGHIIRIISEREIL